MHAECVVRADSTLVTGVTCRSPDERAARARIGALSSTVLGYHLEHPGPDADRLLALWSALASDRPENVARAIGDLRRATRDQPESADLWSDLAAVHLVRADLADDPQSIVEALEAANQALELLPDHGPALFNRALALNQLHLREAAFAAWGAYLADAQQDGWRAEAEELRRATETPLYDWSRDGPAFFEAVAQGDGNRIALLAAQYATDAEVAVVEMLVSEWAEALLERRALMADSLWAVATAVELAIRPVVGASVLRATLDAIRPTGGVHASRQHAHAEALVELHRARVAMRQRMDSVATRLLLDAGDRLRRLDNPLSILADYDVASVRFVALDNSGARRALERLLQVLPSVRWNYWAARAQRLLGTIAATETQWDVRRSYAEAVLTRAHLTARGVRALPYSDLAYAQLALGGAREALGPTYEALRVVGQIGSASATATVVGRAAEVLATLGYAEAALIVQEAAVLAARSLGPVRRVGPLRRRAELNLQAGRHAAAAADLDSAFRLVDSIATTAQRASTKADLTLVRGELDAALTPDSALATLPQLRADFVAQEYSFKLSRVHVALATAQLALGQPDAAENSLMASIETIERQGMTVRRDELASLRDRARPVFERLVLLQTQNVDVRRSFEFFEQMRARVLVEASEAGGSRPAEVDVRAPLDGNTALLSFGVFDDRLLTWIVTRDTLDLIEQPIPARDVREAVDDLRTAILSARDRAAREVATQLYEWLLAPVAAKYSLPERLVLVPDRSLHYLPFVALWNARRGRYLIADHELVVAPDAGHYARTAHRRSMGEPRESSTVLAIGDPAFPVERYSLPPLPHADAEARAVAAEWGSNQLRLGVDATREAFLESVERASILHFAGHAVLRPESPLDSYLLFAADADGVQSAELSSRDLLDLELPNTELVILSACATADGRLSETGGPISLARGFLGAGASSVVSSLWAVMDDGTASFFADFHRRLAGGGVSPAAALRETQLRLLSESPGSGPGMAAWAAFQVYGAG